MPRDPSDRVVDLLRDVRYGAMGVAAVAVPDWPDGDPRWDLASLLSDQATQLRVLDAAREQIQQEHREAIAAFVRDGRLTRPQLASALDVPLHEVLELLGEA